MNMYFVEPLVPVRARSTSLSRKSFDVPATGWFVDVLERRKQSIHLHFGSSSGWVEGSPLTPVQFIEQNNVYDPSRYKDWVQEDIGTVLEDLQLMKRGSVIMRGDVVFNRVSDLGFWSVEDRFMSPAAYCRHASIHQMRYSMWTGV